MCCVRYVLYLILDLNFYWVIFCAILVQQLKSWVSSCRTETILRPRGPLWSFEATSPHGESISSVVSLNLTQMYNPAKKYVLNLNTCWCCTVPQMITKHKWSRDRKWSPKWTANDPSHLNESPKNACVGVYPVFPRQIQDIQRRFLV